MIVVSFITLKYHFGFNETRKFHELQQVNKECNQRVQIDETFKNLNWVSLFKGDPLQEILIINKVKKALEQINDKEITNYALQFLDSITKKNLNYPNELFLQMELACHLNKIDITNIIKTFKKIKFQKEN